MKTKKYAAAITDSGKGPWYDWLESEEGKAAMDVGILVNCGSRQYLENRLWRAYTAGMKKGFEQASGKVDEIEAQRYDNLGVK